MGNVNASEQITHDIKELQDWRGKMLARLRKVIMAAARSRKRLKTPFFPPPN
jgi:hypothetical protein